MSDYLEKSKKYKGYHYSVLNKDDYEYIHNRTLIIFKEIRKILDENKIDYMICGGTLLGATTTGHFIPWDDDFDMCILEKDYENAINLLLKDLPNDIIVQCKKTEPNYFHGWVKVRDKNSHIEPATKCYKNNGAWVDIYKLIPTKEKKVPLIITQEHIDYLKRRLKVGDITNDEYKKRIKSNHLHLKKIKQIISEYFSLKRNDVYIIMSASKIILNKEWVFPLNECTLEGEYIKTFHDAEKYLIKHYGEKYKILPSDELRHIGINKLILKKTESK